MILVKIELHSAASGKVTPLGRVVGWRRTSKTVFDLLAAALRSAGYAALLLCAEASAAQAQHVDLGLDVGKAYSVVDGAWVPAVIPSVSALFGPITLSTSTYLSGKRFFEQDTMASWYQREDDVRRWSFYGNVGHYKYPKGYDWTGSVGVRWRVR